MRPWLSIIIPVYNEEAHISRLIVRLAELCGHRHCEILVSDGGSTDATVSEVQHTQAKFLHSPQKGRAAQMNYAASQASGHWLFFIHADSWPPDDFLKEVQSCIEQGYQAGCFRLKFQTSHWFLRANAWFTRFNVNAFRFGDQGLLVARALFEKLGGYREDHIVLEDQEIVHRIRGAGTAFKVMPNYMETSARKYEENGPMRLQYVFFLVWLNYQLGRPQEELVSLYKARIKDLKIDEKDTQSRGEAPDDIYQKPLAGPGENPPG